MLNDAATGVPAAILDGGPITAERTAAVSGVAIAPVRAARRRPRAAGGAHRGRRPGPQPPARSSAHVLPGVELAVFDRHPERAEALADAARATDGIGAATVAADARDGGRRRRRRRHRRVVRAGPPGHDRRLAGAATRSSSPVDYATYCAAEVARDAALFLVDQREQFLANRDAGLFDGYPDPAATLGEAILAGTPRPARVGCVVDPPRGRAGRPRLRRRDRARGPTALGLGTILPR